MGIVQAAKEIEKLLAQNDIELRYAETSDSIAMRGNYLVFERQRVAASSRRDLTFGLYVVTTSISRQSGALETLDKIILVAQKAKREGLRVAVQDTTLLKAEGSMYVYRIELTYTDI